MYIVPIRVPGGMVGAWIVTILPLIYAAVASYFILIPTDASVSSFSVSRLTYELSQFLPLAFIFLLTVVFFVWGHMETKNRDVVVDLATSETEFSAGAGE